MSRADLWDAAQTVRVLNAVLVLQEDLRRLVLGMQHLAQTTGGLDLARLTARDVDALGKGPRGRADGLHGYGGDEIGCCTDTLRAHDGFGGESGDELRAVDERETLLAA